MGSLPDVAKRSDSADTGLRLGSTPPLPPITRATTLDAPGTAGRRGRILRLYIYVAITLYIYTYCIIVVIVRSLLLWLPI